MLEVGGNIGRSTIVAAEMIGPSGRVYSCEANQDQKQKQADHAKGLIEQKRVVLLPPISDTKLYQGGWFTTTEKASAHIAGGREEDGKRIAPRLRTLGGSGEPPPSSAPIGATRFAMAA